MKSVAQLFGGAFPAGGPQSRWALAFIRWKILAGDSRAGGSQARRFSHRCGLGSAKISLTSGGSSPPPLPSTSVDCKTTPPPAGPGPGPPPPAGPAPALRVSWRLKISFRGVSVPAGMLSRGTDRNGSSPRRRPGLRVGVTIISPPGRAAAPHGGRSVPSEAGGAKPPARAPPSPPQPREDLSAAAAPGLVARARGVTARLGGAKRCGGEYRRAEAAERHLGRGHPRRGGVVRPVGVARPC